MELERQGEPLVKVDEGRQAGGLGVGLWVQPDAALRRMLSLARMRKDLATPGQEVTVLWGGFSDEPVARIRAQMVELPFIKQHRKDDLSHGQARPR